jgi:hypothetical protein
MAKRSRFSTRYTLSVVINQQNMWVGASTPTHMFLSATNMKVKDAEIAVVLLASLTALIAEFNLFLCHDDCLGFRQPESVGEGAGIG